MPYQLNPSKIPIWKSETELALGLSGQNQKLADVSHAQERLIHLLFQGIPEDQLNHVGASVGLDEIETQELITQLRPSLLDQPTRRSEGTALDVRFAEIIRIGFETDQTPESVLARRAAATVIVEQLNRTGLMVIKTLSEAGFCRFETTDYGFIKREDIGELSFSPTQLGLSRLAATREILSTQTGKFIINHSNPKIKKGLRISVLSAMHQLNPRNYRAVENPYIAIEYGIENLRISQAIVPGLSPCLGCRDLWTAENDSNWAATAIQLTARNDYLDDGAGLLMSSAIGAKTVCLFVDGEGKGSTSGYQVDLKNRSVQPYGWQFHPRCSCRSRSL